jgi:hypothetical protein
MLEELTKRLVNWTDEKTIEFYKFESLTNEDAKDTKGRYMWETTNTGVFLWRNLNAFFFQNDGKVYKLSKKCPPFNWDLHKELYDISLTDTAFRMEIPVYGKVVMIDNRISLYTEVQRPNYEIGSSMLQDVMSGLGTTEYFIEYVFQVGILLQNLKKLDKKYNCGFPDHIPKYTIDSIGGFWYDFKDWRSHPDSIEFYKRKFLQRIYMFEDDYNILIDKKKIFELVHKEWNVL